MLQELHLLLLPPVEWLTLPRGTPPCTPCWPVARACNRCKLQHPLRNATNISNAGAGVWQSRSDGRVYGADSGEGRSGPPQKARCHPSTLLGPHGCPSDNTHGQQDSGFCLMLNLGVSINCQLLLFYSSICKILQRLCPHLECLGDLKHWAVTPAQRRRIARRWP